MPTSPPEESAFGYSGQTLGQVKRWRKNWDLLDSQYKQGWEALHKDLADYICLGRGRFIDRGEQPNQKTKAAHKVVNNTATDALHMLGAGLHGGLSSPARPWFKLGFMDPEMDRFKQYRNWLDSCEKVLYSIFKRSNFYTVIHHLYEEIGGFGSGAMFIEAHPQNVVNFTVFTAGDYRFSVKPDGRTHSLYRYFRMQAAQVASEFGIKNCSDRVKRLLQNNQFDWVDIYHVLEPNEQHDPNKLDSKPWVSAYFEAKRDNANELKLSYGGYQECPAVTPRWMPLSNEAWSHGPGPESLQLVKALQKMELSSLKASDKMLDPPMRVPPSMRDRMMDMTPAAKNVVDEADGKFEPLVVINPMAIEKYENKIRSMEERIRRNFYNEIFLMISQQPAGGDKMTAAEIVARNQEKMLMLGPTVESQEYELLDPVIERVFAIAARDNKLPPPPKDLQGTEYRVEFISILAQAQKLLSTQGMGSYLATAERVALVDPGSVVKTDWDKFLEETADAVGVPQRILRDDDQTAGIRQQAQAAAEQEKQMAAGAAEVDARAKLANAPAASPENALGQTADAIEGNA